MIVVSVENLVKRYGPDPVLAGVGFEVHPGERVGLVGPNGTGKTTLLRILAGREEADSGKLELHPTVKVGYLEQQPIFQPGRTLWEEARGALDALFALQQEALEVAHRLSQTDDQAEHDRLAQRYDHLQHELHSQDAYNLDHRIERVLDGLGFRPGSYSVPVESLSGGEQNRLMLACLLLAAPDLMLLDEPSNHLDIEATQWLEEFLTAGRSSMILVSHDRYFLDKVTNRTFELFQGTVEAYTGNFSAYRQQKQERLLVQRRTYERQQIEIAKVEDFIRRNHYGQKAAQAEDRRKKLERIERVPPPREIGAPMMGFPPAARSGDIVLRAEGLSKSYDRQLFRDVSFQITRGQRWGLLGPNGSGKTTLLKALLGQVEPDSGRAVIGQGVEVGYFDQHLGSLADDAPVMDAIRPPRMDFVEQKRRDLLARFGLIGDTALQPVGKLSGGERCRAALARLAAAEANFLILDEPTNHLDLWARDALEQALRQFDGTVLFVSHDRYFVNQVADHLLIVEPDRIRVVEGNYDTYLMLTQGGNGSAPAAEARPSKAASRQEPDKTDRPSRKRRFPFRKIEDIEEEIQRREAHVQELHQSLADPAVLRDGAKVRSLMALIEDEQANVKQLYEHWEEAAELNW